MVQIPTSIVDLRCLLSQSSMTRRRIGPQVLALEDQFTRDGNLPTQGHYGGVDQTLSFVFTQAAHHRTARPVSVIPQADR